jgi:hypothetical protein
LELIESRPGVCGGAACIVGTRIPIWMLYEAHLAGMDNGVKKPGFSKRSRASDRNGIGPPNPPAARHLFPCLRILRELPSQVAR